MDNGATIETHISRRSRSRCLFMWFRVAWVCCWATSSLVRFNDMRPLFERLDVDTSEKDFLALKTLARQNAVLGEENIIIIVIWILCVASTEFLWFPWSFSHCTSLSHQEVQSTEAKKKTTNYRHFRSKEQKKIISHRIYVKFSVRWKHKQTIPRTLQV